MANLKSIKETEILEEQLFKRFGLGLPFDYVFVFFFFSNSVSVSGKK